MLTARPSLASFADELFVESLEARIAPATFAGGNTVTFTDIDGDEVTIKFNQKLPSGSNIENIVKFDGSAFGDTGPQKLQELDLTQWNLAPEKGPKFSVTISVKKAGGGDGSTTLDFLNGKGVNINTFRLQGTLGGFTLGSGDASINAVERLEMTHFGIPGVSDPADPSTVNGNVKLGVKITGNVGEGRIEFQGNVPRLEIGGALSGGKADQSGSIQITGTAQQVSILGGIQGDEGKGSGRLEVGGNIGVLQIKNGLAGGDGAQSGTVTVGGNIGILAQTGNVEGGQGAGSGSIEAGGVILKAAVKGDVKGGVGQDSGALRMDSFGSLNIQGNIQGGGGLESGGLFSEQGGKAIKVTGSLLGGDGDGSAFVTVANGTVNAFFFGGSIDGTFGTGANVAVADFNGSGTPAILAVNKVQVGGAIAGGGISIFGDAGTAKVGGNILFNGFFDVSGNLQSFTSRGDVSGGLLLVGGDLGKANLGGVASGSLEVGGNLNTMALKFGVFSGEISIGGNAGSLNFGRYGLFGSFVEVGGNLASAKIHEIRNFLQGPGSPAVLDIGGHAGTISILKGAASRGPLLAVDGNLNVLTIGPSPSDGVSVQILSGAADPAGIFIGGTANTLNFKGAILGTDTNPFFLNVIGSGSATSTPAVNLLSVSGSTEFSNFVIGYDLADPTTVNSDAWLNKAFIKGDFLGSSLSVNVVDSADDGFGAPTNTFAGTAATSTLSRIQSVTIGGSAQPPIGSYAAIVAAHIVNAKIGGQTLPLDPGPRNDDITLPSTFVLSELP